MSIILEFVKYNNTELENPIQWELPNIPQRLIPIDKQLRISLAYAEQLGFGGLGNIYCYKYGETAQRFPVGRYYLKNGNYFEVAESSSTEFYAQFKWGYKYKNYNPGQQFVLLRNMYTVSNPTPHNPQPMNITFYTNGINTIISNIYTVKPSKNDDVNNTDLSIHPPNTNITPDVIKEFFGTSIKWEEDTNEPQGGMGDIDNDTEDIILPDMPTLEPLDCGMFTMYAPTTEQIKQFSNYLWSSSIFDTLPKLFQDPMEALIGLSIIPVNFPLGSQKEIKVGNIGTNVSSLTVAKQFYELDCGKIKIMEYWGNALDYNNTKIELYLPFISTITLDPEICMNSTISVKYRIDLFTGTCIAYVTVEKPPLKASMFSFVGNCAVNIPLSARNFSQTISTLAGLGITALSGAVSGGTLTPALLATTGLGALGSAVSGGMKTHVQKMNSVQMQAGYFGVWKPYLIITRPVQALPSEFETFKGYTSLITAQIGSTSGYCEVEYIHLDNIPATADELSEIEEILKSGIII